MTDFLWCKCGCKFNNYEVKMHDYMRCSSERQKVELARESMNRDLCKKHAKERHRNGIVAAIKKQKTKKHEAQQLLQQHKERKQNLKKRLDELNAELAEVKRLDDGTYGKPDDGDEKKVYYDSSSELYSDRKYTENVEGCLEYYRR